MPAHSVPPQHQTDPAKAPGQIVNRPEMEGMMDDMALHAFMNRKPAPGTVGEYARRKSDEDFKPDRDLPSGWDHV